MSHQRCQPISRSNGTGAAAAAAAAAAVPTTSTTKAVYRTITYNELQYHATACAKFRSNIDVTIKEDSVNQKFYIECETTTTPLKYKGLSLFSDFQASKVTSGNVPFNDVKAYFDVPSLKTNRYVCYELANNTALPNDFNIVNDHDDHYCIFLARGRYFLEYSDNMFYGPTLKALNWVYVDCVLKAGAEPIPLKTHDMDDDLHKISVVFNSFFEQLDFEYSGICVELLNQLKRDNYKIENVTIYTYEMFVDLLSNVVQVCDFSDEADKMNLYSLSMNIYRKLLSKDDAPLMNDKSLWASRSELYDTNGATVPFSEFIKDRVIDEMAKHYQADIVVGGGSIVILLGLSSSTTPVNKTIYFDINGEQLRFKLNFIKSTHYVVDVHVGPICTVELHEGITNNKNESSSPAAVSIKVGRETLTKMGVIPSYSAISAQMPIVSSVSTNAINDTPVHSRVQSSQQCEGTTLKNCRCSRRTLSKFSFGRNSHHFFLCHDHGHQATALLKKKYPPPVSGTPASM